MNLRTFLKKLWHFIWEEDSIWSWLANIAIAFVLIKFLIYPGLGLVLGTTHPVVAVVSGSMEHDGSFNNWWDSQKDFYNAYNISEGQFRQYDFRNGFNTGDIMLLRGTPMSELAVGNVIVYQTQRPDPIIHRVIKKYGQGSQMYFQTKGDHNFASNSDEKKISEQQIIGKAFFRIPYLGWIKIAFVDLIRLVTG
jgi:signal peptidase I